MSTRFEWLARLWRDPVGRASLIVIGLLVVIAAVGPTIGDLDPLSQDRPNRFAPPSLEHPFGTDDFGRDILARVVFGIRLSLLSAAGIVALAVAAGVPLGLIAGYLGGRTDTVIMRILDALLAVPAILLAMAIVAVLGPSPVSVVVALSVVSIPAYARLTRATTLSIKERDFVLAARSIGATTPYIMSRTVLPNATSAIIVHSANVAALAILLEAALSFLGLGTQPPAPSLGVLVSAARPFMRFSVWYAIFPGAVITIAVLALNGLGQALQRALSGELR